METLPPRPIAEAQAAPAIAAPADGAAAHDELDDESEDRPTWRPHPALPPRFKPTFSGTFEAVPSSKRRLRQRFG